jgi:multidrug resistance efflux pump
MAQSETNSNFFANKMTLGQILTWRPFWAIVAALLAVAAWFLLPAIGGQNEAAKTDAKPQMVYVKTIRLEKRSDFLIPVWYTGQVRARRKTQVAFQRAGKVTEIKFDEGDSVTEGQLIALLDARQVNARMHQMSAQLLAIRARRDELKKGPRIQAIRTAQANVTDFQQQLANANLDLEREGRLLRKNAGSQQEYDRAKYSVTTLQARIDAASAQLEELKVGTRIEQVDAAEAQLESARAAAEIAEHDFDDCTLRAPFSGTITRRMIDEGAVVDSGTPVFELVESSRLELSVGLPVEICRDLNPGDSATVDVSGVKVTATLRAKRLAMDRTTRTQAAIFDLATGAATQGIVDNQMGRIKFEKSMQEAGFLIPTNAIVNDQQGLWNCYTVEERDGKTVVQRQSVEVLHFQGDFVFVRGTITEGQRVVAEGLQRLTSGQVVQLKSEGDE